MKNSTRRNNPVLSIVTTARNDDHGGNMLHRMQLHLDGILSQSKRYGLEIEIILVEWNPPSERPRLVHALSWPADPGPCSVRIIEVPFETHSRFKYSDELPLFQMIGKNVGIRRASGQFILATNIDILFSDEMIRFLASGRLKRKHYYRTNRYDISQNIPAEISHEGSLEFCRQNIIRISDREGVRNLKDGSFFRIFQPMNWYSRFNELNIFSPADVSTPSLLFTNACGDFTLMAREHWFDLYGYPELEMYSFHLDSLLLHAAYHKGLSEKTIKDPMRIYHIDHGIGSGWTPEGQDKLNHRLHSAGIPRISDQDLEEWTLQMHREGRPVIFSNEKWGLADEKLPETFVYGKERLKLGRSGKPSAPDSHPVRKTSPANHNYLVLDSKSRISANPLVSVVIPCLNRAEFLVPTIESILEQDYQNIECIVVDGGSTDGTKKVLKSYGDRITWISEPDKGHADAINKGWRMSKGEILAWLNADDVWEATGAAGQVVEYFKAHPEVSLMYGDCGRIDANGNRIGMSYVHKWDLLYAVENCDHCIPQPAAFIRRTILEKAGWLDTDFLQKKDHEFWLRISLNGVIRYNPVLLAHARKIIGLSDEGKSMARSCVQVLRKFYSLPNVPSAIRRKKRRAISNSYLKGVDYAFTGGRHWKIVFSCALRAFLACPASLLKVLRCLKRILTEGAEEGLQDNRILFRMGWRIIHESLRGIHTFGVYSIIPKSLRKIRWCINGKLPPRTPNLLGDRDIEWSWVASKMPEGPGKALDLGPGSSCLSFLAAQKGYNVTAIDLQAISFPYTHTKLHFIHGDILKTPLPSEHFDLVINCSTVEHIGMAGRYGAPKNLENGDLESMSRLRELMKSGAKMLLTVPVGIDAVCAPLCRIYGGFRLPLLMDGFTVEKEAYWIKDSQNRWVLSDRKKAVNVDSIATSWNPLRNVYALGCFVLKKE